MVDTVLYFEGDSNNDTAIRTSKIDLGQHMRLPVMTDKGAKSVNNPSKIFTFTREKTREYHWDHLEWVSAAAS